MIHSMAAPAAAGVPFTWLAIDRWIVLLGLLSLDAARPSWPAMGLEALVPRQEEWLSVLRGSLAGAAERWNHDRDSAPALVPDTLAAVSAELGAPAARALLRFGRFVFARGPEDHPELFAWQALLDACVGDAARGRWLGLRPEVHAALDEANRRSPPPARALDAPLSPWDMRLLTAMDDGDCAAIERPARLLAWTSRAADARRAWGAVVPLLSEDEREDLAWSATRLAGSLGLLGRDAVLCDPATLCLGTQE